MTLAHTPHDTPRFHACTYGIANTKKSYKRNIHRTPNRTDGVEWRKTKITWRDIKHCLLLGMSARARRSLYRANERVPERTYHNDGGAKNIDDISHLVPGTATSLKSVIVGHIVFVVVVAVRLC